MNTLVLRAASVLLALGFLVPAFARADTASDLQAQIQSLLAQVQQLQTQLANLTNGGGGSPNPHWCNIFNYQNLQAGSRGAEVAALQADMGAYLSTGPTGYYGPVTQSVWLHWCHGVPPVVACTQPAPYCVAGTHVVVDPNPYGCGYQHCVQDTVTGQAPSITSFSGPTTLAIGQSGTWSVTATDPLNGQLTYSISWGDAVPYGTSGDPRAASMMAMQQTTFTHSYATAGTYTVSITVRNNSGQSAQSTATVQVNGGVQPTGGLSASPTWGSAPLSVQFTSNVSGFHSGSTQYLIRYGDGSSDVAASCYAPSDYCLRAGTNTHTYQSAGTYTAQLVSTQGGCGLQQGNFCTALYVPEQVLGTVTITVTGGGWYGGCYSGGVQYQEGAQQSCINQTSSSVGSCIADAYYVCRSGTWQIQSIPWGSGQTQIQDRASYTNGTYSAQAVSIGNGQIQSGQTVSSGGSCAEPTPCEYGWGVNGHACVVRQANGQCPASNIR